MRTKNKKQNPRTSHEYVTVHASTRRILKPVHGGHVHRLYVILKFLNGVGDVFYTNLRDSFHMTHTK